MTEPVRPLEALIAAVNRELGKHYGSGNHCGCSDKAREAFAELEAALLQAAAPPAPTTEPDRELLIGRGRASQEARRLLLSQGWTWRGDTGWSAPAPLPAPPVGCSQSLISSRVCERGTKCCDVRHAPLPAPTAERKRIIQGSWPEHCEPRAFVEGALWQIWKEHGATGWACEREDAEDEAVLRYGDPDKAAPPERVSEGKEISRPVCACDTPLPSPMHSFDARVWAESFVAHVKQYPDIPSDTETMTTWFASALMRGVDEARR